MLSLFSHSLGDSKGFLDSELITTSHEGDLTIIGSCLGMEEWDEALDDLGKHFSDPFPLHSAI